jgi:hypothetical protein
VQQVEQIGCMMTGELNSDQDRLMTNSKYCMMSYLERLQEEKWLKGEHVRLKEEED